MKISIMIIGKFEKWGVKKSTVVLFCGIGIFFNLLKIRQLCCYFEKKNINFLITLWIQIFLLIKINN